MDDTNRQKLGDYFYGMKPEKYAASLGLDRGSLEADTIESLIGGMRSAANRMEDAAYWIRSNMEGVYRSMARIEETGDYTAAHLNSLGELQGHANAFDGGVAQYAALSDQLDMLVRRIKDRNEEK